MNLFWSIYKNLEKELIELSNKIHFCDKQNEVYSVHISDLLIRTAVEIEALSKELYKLAGGNMKPLDKEGNERDLFFDTDCIQYLDLNWGITKKCVNVVSPNFYFKKTENLVLRPLKDCNKRGSGRWKKAYQAVKHNRVESLAAGNIANLIRAMAALYLLNLYYRNEKYDVGTRMNTVPFDTRMGSDIFSVSLAHAEEYDFDRQVGDESILDVVKMDIPSSVLIQKYTNDSYIMLCNSMKEYNEESKNRLLQAPETTQFIKDNPDYKFKSLLSFANDIGGEEFANRMLSGQSIVKDIYKSNMEVILNKGQQIYPLLSDTREKTTL